MQNEEILKTILKRLDEIEEKVNRISTDEINVHDLESFKKETSEEINKKIKDTLILLREVADIKGTNSEILKTKIRKLTEQIIKLQNEVNNITKEKHHLEEVLKNVKESYEKKIEELNYIIEQQRLNIKKLKEHEQKIQQIANSKSKNISHLYDQIQKLTQELEAIKKEKEKYENTIKELKEENKNKIKELNAIIEQQRLNIKKLKEQIKLDQQKNKEIINDKNQTIEQLNQEIQKLTQEINEIKSEKENTIEELNRKIIELEVRLDVETKNNVDLSEEREKLEQENKKLKELVQQLKFKLINERNEFLATLEAERKTWEMEKEALIKELTKESLITTEKTELMHNTLLEQAKLIENLMYRHKRQMDEVYELINVLKTSNDERFEEMRQIIQNIKAASEVVGAKVKEEKGILTEVKEIEER